MEILETGWENFQNAAGPMRQSSLFSAAVCAGLYLTAGIIGAVASSAAVTRKNPLEMLQVKE